MERRKSTRPTRKSTRPTRKSTRPTRTTTTRKPTTRRTTKRTTRRTTRRPPRRTPEIFVCPPRTSSYTPSKGQKALRITGKVLKAMGGLTVDILKALGTENCMCCKCQNCDRSHNHWTHDYKTYDD